jgi:hypothetical protein
VTSCRNGFVGIHSLRGAPFNSSFLPYLEGDAVVAQELVVVCGLAAEEPVDILSRGCSFSFAIEPLPTDRGIRVPRPNSGGDYAIDALGTTCRVSGGSKSTVGISIPEGAFALLPS